MGNKIEFRPGRFISFIPTSRDYDDSLLSYLDYLLHRLENDCIHPLPSPTTRDSVDFTRKDGMPHNARGRPRANVIIVAYGKLCRLWDPFTGLFSEPMDRKDALAKVHAQE